MLLLTVFVVPLLAIVHSIHSIYIQQHEVKSGGRFHLSDSVSKCGVLDIATPSANGTLSEDDPLPVSPLLLTAQDN